MASAVDLQVLIQKFQTLSEEEYKEEDTNVFLVTCQKCLEEDQLEVLLDTIKDEKNQILLRNMGWNLIGPITKCMQSCALGSEKEKGCLQMLNGLIQVCNPKEILLGILEQIDEAAGDHISRIILPLLQPLQIVLLKLGNKRAYSVGLSLSTLHSRLSRLPVPYTAEQMQEDKHLLCQCCLALVQFAQPFIDTVSQSMDISTEPDVQEMRKELLTFCFSCLQSPLLSAQLNALPEDEDDNPFRVFAKEIITGVWSELTKIEQNFLKPLHTGLNMSRAHYEAEMRSTNEKKKGSQSVKPLCTVTAGGHQLPDMTPEMQLQVLQSALFTFDLMESVLARVEELIEVKLKSAPEEKIGS
ncbi:hypothetical protein GDO81_017784, partial [Engystomops pustulosus]